MYQAWRQLVRYKKFWFPVILFALGLWFAPIAIQNLYQAWASLTNTEKISTIQTIATIVGGLAIFLNLKQSHEQQITDRYSKAVEQLGSSQLSVRIGGIYALERIAKDSPKDHWTIMEVLTAFVRRPPPLNESTTEALAGRTRPIDADVQAALTVIGRRDASRDPQDKPLDLNHANLWGAVLQNANLHGANLIGVDLSDANLCGSNLEGAFLAEARLEGARFNSQSNLRETYLKEAKFDYKTNFTGADLTGAILEEVTGTRVNFEKAVLTRVNFDKSKLAHSKFRGANLQDATLRAAELNESDFSKTILKNTSFQETNLSGACLRAINWGSECTDYALSKLTKLQPNVAPIAKRKSNRIDRILLLQKLYSSFRVLKTRLGFYTIETLSSRTGSLKQVTINKVSFKNTVLSEADLGDSNFRDADFTGAILNKTQLQNTILDGADFSRVDLTNVLHFTPKQAQSIITDSRTKFNSQLLKELNPNTKAVEEPDDDF
ncbi:pentapeptide repeat-containing protein [Oscillatoria sp. FACHB-1407]|uniref:pentapeptide repeat-containing protein n=1 Tax=Oscillatoria sp. FACHB-1407 TaxID=2692847 RepID=UPI001688F2AE|nr:pentapeptide repeat-containing protein [Oscillatoria sp. FACHB-1407]MBD2464384.1 pentapeptide repeat-containing protein [Oscillatoria sp. FACHB-1407]